MERKYKPKQKVGHRYFIAFMPEKEVRANARDIQRGLYSYAYKFQFINLEQLYFSLKFLGNAVSEKTGELIMLMLEQVLKENEMRPFPMKVEEIQFGFGNETIPHVLHFRVEDSPIVNAIVDIIQDITQKTTAEDLIKRRENARFVGHITLARVRKDISKSHVRQVREKIIELFPGPFDFTVSAIYLIESELTRHGPVYKIRRKIDFSK
jgi:2'-5' RNA ligase